MESHVDPGAARRNKLKASLHPERGAMTFRVLIEPWTVRYDLNDLGQMEALAARFASAG